MRTNTKIDRRQIRIIVAAVLVGLTTSAIVALVMITTAAKHGN